MDEQKEWKKSVGFPINYSPENSDDDFDLQNVVMRHPRKSELLLADEGDGAAADLLGTTPPRERIRNKSKRRAVMEAAGLRINTKDANEQITQERDRPRTRLSLKIQRARERDFKQGNTSGATGGPRADSLPSPAARASRAAAAAAAAAVPTLVESCNRFMSLSSRLKCSEARGGNDNSRAADDTAPLQERRGGGGGGEELPPSRVNFHKTFSMLINMGNIDKGCRRTMSREEQVWQNELKDLIWLELQARIAGRSLADQDAFLCAQRTIVPNIIHNILTYKFVNKNPCRSRSQRLAGAGARNELCEAEPDSGDDDYDDVDSCCLSFTCNSCTATIGSALREVGGLLDSYHRALRLYPSSHALTADHPPVATPAFKSTLKAMCLWYNTALHMRLKVLAVRRMIRTMKHKTQRQHHKYSTALSTDSEQSRSQPDTPRPCMVRFNVCDTPPSSTNTSNNSDTSSRSGRHKDSGKDTDDEPLPSAGRGGRGERGERGEHHTAEQNKTEGEESQELTRSQNDEEANNEDVVDRAEPPIPEIVISDARYDTADTADTADTSESGYTSAADAGSDAKDDDVYDLGDLSDITELRLLNRAPVSIYRSYHHEMLKTQGVRRCLSFINKMRCNLLHKVYLTFEKPDGMMASQYRDVGSEAEVFDDTRDDDADDRGDDDAYELRRYGCYSEESLAMRLPSYRSHFLLLCAVCMEAVHDYLSLRLEDRPLNPSCLTVKQLIHELKEGLDMATEMRAAFARNIEVALEGQRAGRAARADLLLIIRSFDDTVETVLKQYLSYLRTMSAVEQMSRASLQAEWAFTARLARRVRCAALLAPMTFSEIACNQLDRVAKQFKHKFEQLEEFEKSASDPDTKHFVYTICRAVQAVYASEREAALHAAQWARSLAARLARLKHHTDQRQAIFTSMMSIRDLIVAQTRQVLERSRADLGEEADALALTARVRELMLQIYRLGFELHKELYRFVQAPLQLEQERSSRRRVVSLQPVPQHDHRERPRRPETMLVTESINPLIHRELHRFVHDSDAAAAARGSAVTSRAGGAGGAGLAGAGGGRPRYFRAESIGEDVEPSVFDDRLFENINNYQTHSSIELFLMGESGELALRGEALHGSALASRAAGEERRWAALVGRAVVEFAHCWMQFVLERCEKGRGLRPRWAHQGLEFLMLACDPCNTRHLSEQEFEELKRKMDGCISHVIGARPPTPRADHAPLAPHAPSPQDHKTRRRHNRIHSPLPPGAAGAPGGRSGSDAAPPTPPHEHNEPNFNFPEVDFAAHSGRVFQATQRLDAAREQKLAEARAVGRVLAAPVTTYEPKLRQLNFKWQRGLKIGAGTFGKVYTVVNTETGQLLAMKEISIGAGDRRALQRAANELRVLEGVIHPHLVRYYGCELHREEMLIFMELCVEGSLEALVATSGALQEHMVRRYTKQLVSAVAELHARGIAHRDIKSGNIFLTNEGHCLKLGDFGCAVKIRANTTAAGELMGHVGTQAYMAPEVFMKASGHGRAADVWSLGCVVVEMAQGKRPFSAYDSNVQIMFVVGMGGRPDIPDTLSEEGQAFCRAALTHEPDQRPKAEHLLMHHFLKLKTDDDCRCEPAYLLT